MGEPLKNKHISPFNSHLEIGLRVLSILTEAFPNKYSIRQLAVLDYLLVHSDDTLGGPNGLHPKIPQRSGEYFIRKNELDGVLKLLKSKYLINEYYYKDIGILFSATESSIVFLDCLKSNYSKELRSYINNWLIKNFGKMNENQLNNIMLENIKNRME
ncbi:ABC-three component system middle component 2 [Silvanigrella sp.]|jgi:hypothetical protein|uniref:ABC-three component system middle component 2 n=1 Tax=Silvanigrella sp. TaxID=2024976 RepID=UPI0037CA5F2A